MKTIPVFTLLLLAGCNRAAPGALRPSPGDALLPERGAVLPEPPETRLSMHCSQRHGPVQGTWTPTPRQVRELEAALTPLLRAKLRTSATGPAPRLAAYYRQYAGIVAGGRKLVCVNGVADLVHPGYGSPADTVRWREQPVMVLDGGASVFQAEYDPETRQFSDFAFHGVA